eukprot:scaffold24731_cov43-Tisochrysis_lutea.AAC.2
MMDEQVNTMLELERVHSSLWEAVQRAHARHAGGRTGADVPILHEAPSERQNAVGSSYLISLAA